jgi:hypothetical protein
MKLGLALLLLSLGACVHTQQPPEHECEASCPAGQACDHTIGQCKVDPCEGRCQKWERCEGMNAQAHCEMVPMPAMQYERPDTSAPSSMY